MARKRRFLKEGDHKKLAKLGISIIGASEWETADEGSMTRGQSRGAQGSADRQSWIMDSRKIRHRLRELPPPPGGSPVKYKSLAHLSLDELLEPTVERDRARRRKGRTIRDHEIEEEEDHVPDLLEEFQGYAEYGWEALPEDEE